jgi:hypothetical protein
MLHFLGFGHVPYLAIVVILVVALALVLAAVAEWRDRRVRSAWRVGRYETAPIHRDGPPTDPSVTG